MASRIFLAYANSKKNPLPTLRDEDNKLYEMLSKRESKSHFKIHRDSHITLKKLGKYLKLYKNETIIFHYSGHADRGQLFLEDKAAEAKRIAELLGKCPNLKLVVLNGCSTYGQVKRLLKLKSKPVIIASHAPVDDYSATLFSMCFYEQFCAFEKSIKKSFEFAVQQDKLIKKDIRFFKGLEPSIDESQPIWGCFSESDEDVRWTLPFKQITSNETAFIPNSILTKKLLKSFTPYFSKTEKELLQKNKASGANQIKAVLQPLVLPVSEHLRKLMAPEQIGSANKFFDELSERRLKQICITYNIIIELIAFILLAEVWDLRIRNDALFISRENSKQLRAFLTQSKNNRQNFYFPKFIEMLRELIGEQQKKIFVNELLDLPSFNDSNNKFGFAIAYLEVLKNTSINSLDANEIANKCIKGEEELSVFLSQLAFMTQYSMRSIKSIGLHFYRHSSKPKYIHNIVRVIQTFVNKLEEELDVRINFMPTASVCLLKNGKKGFLNLSPFIIDQNAFEEEVQPDLAMLHYFQTFEKTTNSFLFKHVYKPKEKIQTRNNKEAYKMVKKQFTAFSKLFFNKSIDNL